MKKKILLAAWCVFSIIGLMYVGELFRTSPLPWYKLLVAGVFLAVIGIIAGLALYPGSDK